MDPPVPTEVQVTEHGNGGIQRCISEDPHVVLSS